MSIVALFEKIETNKPLTNDEVLSLVDYVFSTPYRDKFYQHICNVYNNLEGGHKCEN